MSAAEENATPSYKASKDHCAFCFDVLLDRIHNRPEQVRNFDGIESFSCPLFVTWYKHGRRQGQKSLRGCIGTFSSLPLREGLREYALTSAFEDHRFNVIEESEVSQLECDVSLLVDFEDAEDIYDWEIGVHGIQIFFRDRKNIKQSATYLPQVAKEQGWTTHKTILSLLEKAGYRVREGEELPAIRLKRYKSSIASLLYDEYISTYKNKER